MKKPNILFLLADDQRFDTIGGVSNPAVKTPNLDRLAARGSAFTQAHIPSGTYGAVCMPSRAMLNTGRSLFHLDGVGEVIPKEHATIGEAMQSAGYNAHGIGKWHNGTEGYAKSFNSGDNIFFAGMWDHWNVPVCDYHPDGVYDNWIRYSTNPFYSNSTMSVLADRIEAGVHSSQLMSDGAVKFIENYQSDKPFYMYVSYLAPHDPRTMPKEFLDMYDPENIELPENFQPEHFDFGVSQLRDEVLTPYPRQEKEIKRHMAEYYAIISHLDHHIGRVLEALEKKGELENTIIVFTADNGLAVGDHGLMGKQNIYEHSIRVPLIMAGPGVPKGRRFEEYVYLFDIFPTLCEMVGAQIPESVDGKSFAPLFEGKDGGRRELFFAYEYKIRGFKDDRYKLIEYCSEECKRRQLFDLKNDPKETKDLSECPETREIMERLHGRILDYQSDWGDSWVTLPRNLE